MYHWINAIRTVLKRQRQVRIQSRFLGWNEDTKIAKQRHLHTTRIPTVLFVKITRHTDTCTQERIFIEPAPVYIRTFDTSYAVCR